MSNRSSLGLVALLALVACGCSSAQPTSPAAVVASRPLPRPPAPPVSPGWSYWDALDAGVTVRAVAPEPPYAEAQVVRAGGASERWAGLAPNARDVLLANGFVEVPHAPPSARFGESYEALVAKAVPYVITTDALFWLAHVARDRALAAVEQSVLVPALDTLLRRLEARFATEAPAAPADLTDAYPIARGLVAVARALLSPGYAPSPDLAHVVAAEVTRIEAHAGPSRSPLLGVTVDYSEVVPRGASGQSAARAAYATASAWLAAAPLAVVGRTEVPGAELDVGQARARTRAALLVAHAIEPEVDPEAARAWHRLASVADFAGGAPDDPSPHAVGNFAVSLGMDVRDVRALVDTAKLDRLRHALARVRAPRLDDGSGLDGALLRSRAADRPDYLRAATGSRMLPARSTADAEVLQALVSPWVGALAPSAYDPPPATSRARVRALPRALDVAAWLGSKEARAILHEDADDAYTGYESALDALGALRRHEEDRHGSIYASSLDAVAAYLAPSAADVVQPGGATPAWRARKVEGSLAAWTTLRHDALAFARFPLATPRPAPPAPAAEPSELPAFVEPAPETIAALLSVVRQTARGLRVRAEMPADSPAFALVDEVDALLADALALARREASDEPRSSDDLRALASFPTRLRALEATLQASQADEASLAVDVHTDQLAHRALVEACGDLDDLYVLEREPGTGRLVLAVGLVASHYELVFPASDRPADAAWRTRLHGAPPPARADFTRAYRVVPLDAPDAGVADAAGD